MMEKLNRYIKEVLGFNIPITPLYKTETDRLPFYLREAFGFSKTLIFHQPAIIAESKPDQKFTSLQTEKQMQHIKNIFGDKVIIVLDYLSAIDRKRLIERGINFIVPGTQLFLPDFLIDMRENFILRKPKKEKLIPSAQYMLLYKILHKDPVEDWSLKMWSVHLLYTQMGISKAVDNLKQFDLCTTEGTKEKYVRFNKEIKDLWQKALPFLSSPVIKRVFTDELPADEYFQKSNESALPEYSDMAESRQEYRAVEREIFYSLQKKGKWINMNNHEGRFCIEVWKYDPLKLSTGLTSRGNVDPLSLYLSLEGNRDERIESAREQIIDVWINKRQPW